MSELPAAPPLGRLFARLYSRHRLQLLFFSATIAAGTAFLVGVGTLLASLDRAIYSKARELMAGDLRLESNRPLGPAAEALLRRLGAEGVRSTRIVSLNSMLSPAGGKTPFLVSVKAVEPGYPFYGKLETDPPDFPAGSLARDACLIDEAIALREGLRAGDSVRLGRSVLRVAAVLRKEPDRNLTGFNLGPRIVLPAAALADTGLLGHGSRIRHQALLALPPSPHPERAAAELKRRLESELDDPYLQVEAYSESQPSVRQVLDRVSSFFVLVALVALLLGTVGMSAGVAAFLNSQIETVGVLRCLGLGPAGVTRVYGALCLAIGVQGGLLGAVFGWALSAGGLVVLKRVLGLSLEARAAFSWSAAAEGMALACALAVGVNLAKLRALAAIAPLDILRERVQRLPPTPAATALAGALLLAGSFAYVFAKSKSVSLARDFAFGLLGGGCLVALLIFAGLWAFAAALKALEGANSPALRHGVLQLCRRKGRTFVFLFTLSAGFGLLGALGLVHHSLSKEILLGQSDKVPDIFLVDVQRGQREGVARIAKRYSGAAPEFSPLIRARLTHIKGAPVLRGDPSRMTVEERARFHFLTREYNLTYKDTLNPSEKLVAGEYWKPGETSAQLSVERNFSRRIGAGLGDALRFDIQGRELEAKISSIRSIDWLSMRPNFFVVFPEKALEKAPQSFIASVRIRDELRAAAFSRDLVAAYPNVSALNVSDVLDKVQAVLGALLGALKVLAWFCVAVGLLVLAGTLVLGLRERREQAALFKTLGAGPGLLLRIDAVEFLAIGALSYFIAAALSWGLGRFISWQMGIEFSGAPGALALGLAGGLLLPLSVGLAVNALAYAEPVLATLRREA